MNTFSNIFKKSFLEGFGGSDITTVRILVTLAVTCALALYIFIVYYVATKKTFYSKTFNIMNGKTGLPKLYSLWLLLSAFSLSKFLY